MLKSLRTIPIKDWPLLLVGCLIFLAIHLLAIHLLAIHLKDAFWPRARD